MSNAARKIAAGAGEIVSTDPVDGLVNLAKALGDRLRVNILRVLHQDSYAVGELCQVFDVPQPALSHHLKILLTAGLVARRREGNSLFYRRATPSAAAGAFFAELDQKPIERRQAEQIAQIHASRNDRSARFFEENAEEIRAHQAEICDPATYQDVVLELIDDVIDAGLATRQALEVGPGASNLLSALAVRFEKAIGVDNSRSMLASAAAALPADSTAQLKHQDFMALPQRRRYDLLVAAMVIHHQASPATFFEQSAALLKPGGSLIVAELCQHDQEWAQSACGDQWLGFEPDQLTSWAARAGLVQADSHYLAQKNGFRVQVQRFALAEQAL